MFQIWNAAQTWLVPLNIVFNVLRFGLALNWNRFLAFQRRSLNYLNSASEIIKLEFVTIDPFFSQSIHLKKIFFNVLRSPVGRLGGGEWSSPSEDEGRLYPSLGEGEGADKPVPSSFLGLLLCMAWCCFKLPWNEGNYAKILTRGLNSVLYITYYSLTPHSHTVLLDKQQNKTEY